MRPRQSDLGPSCLDRSDVEIDSPISTILRYFGLVMVEPSAFRDLLDELRFDDAEDLVKRSGQDPNGALRGEISKRREEAEERARELARHIAELGEGRKLDEIVDFSHEDSTVRLLALAPDTSRKRAELYLREAERWADNKERINARRLAEARRALDGLDLDLAKGLMKRINGRFLNDELEEERDRLLLDISARAMDVESLAETTRRLTEDTRNQQKGRWWRRRLD